MTRQQAVAPPPAQKMASRQAGLRQATLAILIVLIVQFALGISVNLYVTLPAAGRLGGMPSSARVAELPPAALP